MPDALVAPPERRGNRRETPNSLFGEILDWMLAPLLFLWPISIAATNHVAHLIADQPYDQAMADNVVAISRLIQVDGNRIRVNLPQAAGMVLRTDEADTLYYQVIAHSGRLLQGDSELPRPDATAGEPVGPVLFRDGHVYGEPVRIAYRYVPLPEGQAPLLVQVAETRHKRDELSSRIISGVLLPQFAIIPLAVILVYVGLSRGILPLRRLRDYIRRRRPADLSPIRLAPVPEEVRPLVIAFNEMMERLETNLQAQQRFISQAAHQMRTPLTGLKIQTELALAETDPEQMRLSLQQIAESTARATHLLNQLLMLAQTEASHEKVHRVEPADLEALARAATQEAVPHALAKSIDIGFEGTGWPLMVEGTPLLLRELMTNLVDNAIKYTPDGGRVTVRTRAGEFATLEVEDNGIGIPEEDRHRVFDRFYRVLGTEASGSGLGLPIVAEIAELHRARIDLMPAGSDGRGCLFRVTFPRRGGDMAPIELRPE